MRPSPQNLLISTLAISMLVAAHAGAGTYVWDMDASEDQVNNCTSPPAVACAFDGSTDSPATGHATLTYDTETGVMSYTVEWNGLQGLLSALHIHGPATPSQSVMPHLFNIFTAESDVIAAGVDRTTDTISDSGDFETMSSTSGLPRNLVLEHMLDDLGYVNIHSLDFPMGEIRAHLVLTSVDVPITASSERCNNKLSRDLARVTSKQGRQIDKCLRDHAKGKLVGTLEACIAADPGGKIATARGKTIIDFDKHCTGVDKGGVIRLPLFGAADDPVTVNGAGVDKELSLVHAVFGADLDTGQMATNAGDPDTAGCQLAVNKAVRKCQDTYMKWFGKCKSRGLKGTAGPAGADLPFDDSADLELCVGDDPLLKIERFCDDSVGRIATQVLPRKCVGVDLAASFPGCGVGTEAALATCLDDATACHVCTALNAANDIGVDCDAFAGTTCP